MAFPLMLSRFYQNGERINRITPRVIETDRQSISRADIVARRPAGWSNAASWEAQVSIREEAIRAIEDSQQQEAASRTPQYGRNLDFPNGVRPR